MHTVSQGLLLLVLAGAMNGSFTLPMKYTRSWAWENTWLAWTVFALFVFPPVLTFLTLPQVRSVYAETGLHPVILVAACGAGWGISQVFFGLAVDAIGIALSFSVILGLSAAVGSLVPLLTLHREKILSAAGLGVIAGVVLVAVGVGICAVAGRRREAATGKGPTAGAASMGRGLLYCLFSGLGSALVNFGLAYGKVLIVTAQKLGGSPTWSPNAVWMPLMIAGGVPNLVYCVYLLHKNATTSRFSQPGTNFYWLLAAIMAFFWFGSTVIYGASSMLLGDWGPILAWPLFMSLIVITASLHGIFTGEWKEAGPRPLRIQLTGVAVLILAVAVLSRASQHV
jgi:L-rhamnose-H+ transport protein